ncbi:uncharacterized protein LOC100575013 [Acyrthosiphon pisum]|uniref:Uncharacterized protein n=1 Tax=Acyrthosiphon pisum TaxID=7029 RepID=A0A8R2A9X9_ACYPI|nr:uncharacterized protein LOC100575013 [Acyrthosiphon pisum]|eukprot:XP_003247462.1 PREDICTED: uncharacterized protein LOC100575013 [Acyrthosiphon pisum]
MWPFSRISNKQNPEPNTIVRVPISKVVVDIYKKERKYVELDVRETNLHQSKSWMDNCMSKLRPRTPPGMCVQMKKRLIKKLHITIYKKKRINIPVEMHKENGIISKKTVPTAEK